MQKMVELIYRCDVPLAVAMDSLGRSVASQIDEVPVEIVLPNVKRERSEDRPALIAPSFAVIDRDRNWGQYFGWDIDPSTKSPWGHFHAWHTTDFSVGSPAVRRFGIRFSADRDDLHSEAEAVMSRVAGWWAELKTWVEVVASVNVTTEHESSVVGSELAWTTADDGKSVVRLHPQQRIVGVASNKPGVSYSLLARAAELTCAVPVPLEWQLMREARHRLWQDQWRACVLDAGTAAELALTRLIDSLLGGTPAPAREALLETHRTLGGRATLYPRLGGSLPTSFHNDVVRPRNAATHEGATLSHAVALAAERAVTTLLDYALPVAGLKAEVGHQRQSPNP